MLPTRLYRPSPRFNRGLVANEGIIPPGLQLIRDTTGFRPLDMKRGLMEGRDGKEIPTFRVTGLFQEGDKENANGRIYPLSVLRQAIDNIKEDVDNRAVIGELDHPDDAKVHLDRVSHLVTKVWLEGKKVYGEAEVLDNQPLGRCMRGLFERRIRTGISSRGIGDMEVAESGGHECYMVSEGFSFVTWDCVAEPSVSGAILRPVSEGLRRRLAPIHSEAKRGRLTVESYERALMQEIDHYFGLK